jgi:peptide deformylase
MLEEYPILIVGDPRLRVPSQPVIDIQDPELQRLIDVLLQTVQTANGVGIAAPQLGYPQRVLVLASHPNPRYPQAPCMDPLVVINPETLAVSDRMERGWEGCLSVPGQRSAVDRHHQVEVTYLDRQGQPQQRVWQGFVARIYQHEFDHLEGQLFIDRLDPQAEVLSESTYQAQIAAESNGG